MDEKTKNMKCNKQFWKNLQKLVNDSQIITDRPKGSKHPNYPGSAAYPVDYGYIEDTTQMDGNGIDIFRGSLKNPEVIGIFLHY